MSESKSRSTPPPAPPPEAQTGLRLRPNGEESAETAPDAPTNPLASPKPPEQETYEWDVDVTETPALPPVSGVEPKGQAAAQLDRIDGELTDDDFVETKKPPVVSELSSSPASSRKLILVEESTAPRDASEQTLGPPASLSPGENLVGDVIDGRYRVEAVLGIGSMGVVYAARHIAVGKLVAIKALRPHLMQDSEVVQRFSAEATAATAIGNKHIVDTLDFGTLPDGSAYLVMEMLDGHSLSEVLRHERQLPLDSILRIARQIAVALGAAHGAGIVHRDLKPDNVFLVERDGQADFVKILDFGIAKFGSGQNKLTHAGAVFGTPHYMSPEQALGKATDPRTDVYALGVILYEMAVGKVPFDGESPVAVLTRHATETPLPLARTGRNLPKSFEAIVMKCLAKEPDDRYPSMAALIDDLERIRVGKETQAEIALASKSRNGPLELEHPSETDALKPKRQWGLIAVAALGVLAAGGWLAWRTVTKRTAVVQAPAVLPKPPPLASASIELPTGDQVKTTDVALVLFPLNARVFIDDEDLGQMPVTVKVKEGQPVKVKVVAEGYWTRKITLDGKKKRVVVGLWRKQGSAPPPPERGDQEDRGDEETPDTRAAGSAAVAEAQPEPAKQPGAKPPEPPPVQPPPSSAPIEKAPEASP